MDSLITQLINSKQIAAPAELAKIINHAAIAPFAADLLEADEALWGSFWHLDVISPGYSLPAIELALLRATRLDKHWPRDTTIEQYLADLHQTIRHPQAQIWSLTIADEPCVIFAAPAKLNAISSLRESQLTVVWYCASTGKLHAGYKTSKKRLYFEGAIKHRGVKAEGQIKPPTIATQNWLMLAVEQMENNEHSSLAARLDGEILRQRII